MKHRIGFGMCLIVVGTSIVLLSHSAPAQHLQIGDDIDGDAEDDNFGWSVSLSANGSVVAIGAPNNSTFAGHVRVYEQQSGTWTQIGDDIDGEAAGDLAGWSIDLSSAATVIAVGAPYNDGTSEDAGHVRVYALDIVTGLIFADGFESGDTRMWTTP